MNRNYRFTDINYALPVLLDKLLTEGDEFTSRGGRTLELMHVGISLERPWRREVTVPGRNASVAAQVAETAWVMAGRNDVGWLSNYLPRAADFSDDGTTWRAGYGPRLRDYMGVDQLDYVVGVLGTDPSSRQAVATIWDPTVDTTPGKDLACNNWLSFSSRGGALDLHVGIRSNDAMWGWSGINAFEWSAVLEVVAGLCNLEMGKLHFSTTSFHLYDRHWYRARAIAKDGHGGYVAASPSPRFDPDAGDCWTVELFDRLLREWFEAEHLIRHGDDDAHAAVDAFAEPMLRSWLQVLQWYWSGDEAYLEPLLGTPLREACLVGVDPVGEPQPEQTYMFTEEVDSDEGELLPHINALHTEKHEAYGDSWKRRGEPGILMNIARKVDRIRLGGDTQDEDQTDTAIDLVVYLAKYQLWLEGSEESAPAEVAELLGEIPGGSYAASFDDMLDELFNMPAGKSDAKIALTYQMLNKALAYARSVW